MAALVAAAIVIAGPGAYAAAQTRIGVNGARPSTWPIVDSLLAGMGLTQEGWLSFASHVGENWLPGMTAVPMDYPAQLGPASGPGAMSSDQSTAVGQQNLHAAILRELAKGEPVAVAALSLGTLVVDSEIAYLQNAADAPPARDVKFYVFGDPARGFGDMYLSGITIPFIGQTFHPIPESRYDTVVVIEQWDGLANPPDRPWNLLADLNAVMGVLYTVNGMNDHSRTSIDSMSDAVLVSQTTNSQGATTTTYMVPRQELPLTRPLLQLGIPTWVVDGINNLLRPLIRTGYSSMTPQWGPHIEHGQLVFTPPPVPPAPPAQPMLASAQASAAVAEASPVAVADTPAPTLARTSHVATPEPVAAPEAVAPVQEPSAAL